LSTRRISRRTALAALLALLAVSTASASSRQSVVSSHGVSLSIPSGWARVRPAGGGPVVDPKTLLVVGTRGVAAKRSRCQIAAYRIPAKGAVVVIVGWGSLRDSGVGGITPGRLPLGRLVRVRWPSFECFRGRGAAAEVLLSGRTYQVNVLVGERAPGQVIGQALAVGRSFKLAATSIAAASIVPPAVLPRTPGWHTGSARVATVGCPRCIQVNSWGATVFYRDAANDFPHRTMAALGRDDVIIQVLRSWEPAPPRWTFTEACALHLPRWRQA
jgi:hypothetical protein